MIPRSFPGNHVALTIDGELLGYVKSVSGGNIKGEVATHQLGPDNVTKKHLATIKHEDITVKVGMGMGQSLYEWIQSSFAFSPKTKTKIGGARSGEIVAADFDYKEQWAMTFSNARITECTFPAFDANSKDAAYMALTLKPEWLRYERRSGKHVTGKQGTKTKKWLVSNFTFTLGNLPCERVSKIDSFTLKQSVVEDRGGKSRKRTPPSAKLEIPNLTVTFSAADAEAWERWFTSFVIDGKCADSDELNGQITFVGPDLREVLGRIELVHVGITSLQPTEYNANTDKIPRMQVELYVEEMKLSFND